MAEQVQLTDTNTVEKRQFIIRSCLGRGGFGEVYRASMTNATGLETDVAVKVLHTDLDRDTQSVQRLRDEGRMLGALVHPAIVRVYDLVILEGRIGLVTEYVEGQDLSDCLRADSPLGPRASVAVIGRVADALRAAWETRSPHSDEPLQLIHRDVKPQNIRIGTQGDVKLLDFGVARSSNVQREAHTNTGHMVGSYLYMAPECLLENQFGRESDVFALGATLFESLARRRLFQDQSLRELYILVLNDEGYNAFIDEALNALDAPKDILHLLKSMLCRDPNDRPTAADISSRCDDLVDVLEGPTLRRWCKAHPWPAPDLVEGMLDGRTITEATMATNLRPSFARTPPTRPNHKPTQWRWVAGAVGTLGVFGTLVAIVVALIALVAVLISRPNGSSGMVAPRTASTIATHTAGPQLNAPREVAATEEPTPAPADDEPKSRLLLIDNPKEVAYAVRLRRRGRTFKSGSRAPYGTYTIEAKFKDWTKAGSVRVSGKQTVVVCNALTRTCTKSR